MTPHDRRAAVLTLTAAAMTAAVPAARATAATRPRPTPSPRVPSLTPVPSPSPVPSSAPSAAPSPARPPARPRTPARALDELRAGNARFASLRSLRPREDAVHRARLAVSQHPFAVVLGCVDSRVPPELVFDQGLGDLLTVRSAGQALDEAVLGSLQFGVSELGVRLVVVLGHERCGAIAAAVEHVRTGAPAPGHLQRVVEQLAPSVRAARPLPGDWTENSVRLHIGRTRRLLAADPAFRGAVVLGARYGLGSGKVAFHSS
ncbi:carbonic anhydrase [Streptomyces sp. NPDC001941]|uniref:carbonic anhydrase n=1 Tax=Streptomyces sp. NPDC001941 TaxID=3154659 RepID=UPI0033254CB2